MLLNNYNTQRNVSMMPFHLHSYNKQFYLAMLLLLSMLISQTTAMLSDSDNGNLNDKRMASASSSKLNEQQQQQIPSPRRPFASEGAEGREQFEGSGSPNPDDEDGDTGEGSGDGFEGSGIPPAENGGNVGSHSQSKEQDIRDRTNVEGSATGGINNLLQPNVGDSSDRQSTAITMKAPPSPLSPAIHPNAQPPTTQAPALTTTTSSTKTTTTVTSTKATTAATTPRQKVPFTTARTTTTSTAVPRQHTTPVVLSKAKTPPPYLMDPTGPLDRLKPGLFAIMIGGSVCLLLFLILVVTYVLYRIRKKDEGSYTCEEPIQPHYSYAYQKASIKEFYA